ncbi:hypothetical protein MSWHS_2122 [Methanosarcina sp. WWM596]|nr:hypothetical protein MSWHS_2122 [Methanosarcina sp. WWM596]AKB23141.1 hypothetical protein MSWH1_2870 [Methanosarcina sp. WH1]
MSCLLNLPTLESHKSPGSIPNSSNTSFICCKGSSHSFNSFNNCSRRFWISLSCHSSNCFSYSFLQASCSFLRIELRLSIIVSFLFSSTFFSTASVFSFQNRTFADGWSDLYSSKSLRIDFSEPPCALKSHFAETNLDRCFSKGFVFSKKLRVDSSQLLTFLLNCLSSSPLFRSGKSSERKVLTNSSVLAIS